MEALEVWVDLAPNERTEGIKRPKWSNSALVGDGRRIKNPLCATLLEQFCNAITAQRVRHRSDVQAWTLSCVPPHSNMCHSYLGYVSA